MVILTLLRSVCCGLLDKFRGPTGRHPRQDGAPHHSLPRPGQHLQHRHHQHAQGRGSDCYRELDVVLPAVRVWSPRW